MKDAAANFELLVNKDTDVTILRFVQYTEAVAISCLGQVPTTRVRTQVIKHLRWSLHHVLLINSLLELIEKLITIFLLVHGVIVQLLEVLRVLLEQRHFMVFVITVRILFSFVDIDNVCFIFFRFSEKAAFAQYISQLFLVHRHVTELYVLGAANLETSDLVETVCRVNTALLDGCEVLAPLLLTTKHLNAFSRFILPGYSELLGLVHGSGLSDDRHERLRAKAVDVHAAHEQIKLVFTQLLVTLFHDERNVRLEPA